MEKFFDLIEKTECCTAHSCLSIMPLLLKHIIAMSAMSTIVPIFLLCAHLLYTELYSCLVNILDADPFTMLVGHVVESWEEVGV